MRFLSVTTLAAAVLCCAPGQADDALRPFQFCWGLDPCLADRGTLMSARAISCSYGQRLT
jgi:hypothetical protein